jgi:F1F0 ATPase subunit 2
VNDTTWTSILVALLAGIALGGFYFGSLWWVVRRVAMAKCSKWWLAAGFVARAAITLAGFFLVMNGRWERAALCMVGFLLARSLVLRQLRPPRPALTAR